MKLKLKNNKGVTLIALVITIIILSILAGVSITAVKGNKGIINKAKEAETETRGMSVEEARDLWEVHNEEVAAPKSLDTLLNELIEKKLLTQQEKQEILNSTPHQITIGSKTIIFTEPPVALKPGEIVTGENKIHTKNGKAVIPKGFSIVPGLDDVSQGLVISDVANDTNDLGNQFVWVPVTDMSKFVRQEGYYNGSLDSRLSNCGEANEKGVNEKAVETATTEIEAKGMYKSVKDNGGFYIGRYEAGVEQERTSNTTPLPKVIVKKNKPVYNYIGWEKARTMANNFGGAVEVAREMYTDKNTYGVKSTLCYGVQWDAALNFIDSNYITNGINGKPNCESNSYIVNSTGRGNHNGSLIYTGSNDNYAVKNIYDMAGNVFEWTMESYFTYYRVNRGGNYKLNGSDGPSSIRNGGNPTISGYNLGFRVTLYV